MVDVVVVGSFVQDLAFRTDQFPHPGETRIGTFFGGPGGKGFNQAVAAHRLGVGTLFVGAVGRDIFADTLRNFAEAEGMTLHLQLEATHSTGAASIVVNSKGENQIVVALGANDALTPAHIDGAKGKITTSKVVLVQVEGNLDAAGRALSLARENKKIGVLNPAPINHGISLELIQKSDILIPNETEFSYLLKQFFNVSPTQEIVTLNDNDLHALCNRFGVSTVIITLGESGCFVSHNPEFSTGKPTPFSGPVTSGQSYYRVPGHTAKSIDTTGAGDAFCGAFCAGLIRFSHDFAKAVRFATVAAALSTERKGTAPAMPFKGEVDTILETL